MQLDVDGAQSGAFRFELMADGWVRVDDETGLCGLLRTNGTDGLGDLMVGPWAPYITAAVAEHFGYELPS